MGRPWPGVNDFRIWPLSSRTSTTPFLTMAMAISPHLHMIPGFHATDTSSMGTPNKRDRAPRSRMPAKCRESRGFWGRQDQPLCFSKLIITEQAALMKVGDLFQLGCGVQLGVAGRRGAREEGPQLIDDAFGV